MKTLDFSAHQRAKDSTTIYPGDMVVWRDWNESFFITKVLRLTDKFTQADVTSLSLTKKDSCVLELEHGLFIDGCVIVEKRIR